MNSNIKKSDRSLCQPYEVLVCVCMLFFRNFFICLQLCVSVSMGFEKWGLDLVNNSGREGCVSIAHYITRSREDIFRALSCCDGVLKGEQTGTKSRWWNGDQKLETRGQMRFRQLGGKRGTVAAFPPCGFITSINKKKKKAFFFLTVFA